MSNKKNIKIFFGEIMRELFHKGTPKYYKVNISNPKTLLEELKNYIEIVGKGSYLDENHVKYIIEEYLYRSNKDIIFKNNKRQYEKFNLFLKKFIDSSNKRKQKREEFLFFVDELLYRIDPLLRNLENFYFLQLKKQLFDILNKDDIVPGDFILIKKICYSLSTELLRKGYSTTFIYENIKNKLIDSNDINGFIDLFDGKIYNFEVYFKILSKNDDIVTLFENKFGYENVYKDKFPFIIKNDLNSTKLFGKFFKNNKEYNNSFWIKINSEGLDYGSISNNILDEINLFIDEIKFEYISDNITVFHHALVKMLNGNYELSCINDQLYIHRTKSSMEYFNHKNQKLNNIYKSDIIDNETKEKIKTLFRFYRYFLEANTIEHKFLNLWIGWEHIFSLKFTKEPNTWRNISSYYPYIDSITYVEDILRDIIQVQLNRGANKDIIDPILSSDPKYIVTNLYKIIKEKNIKFDELIDLKLFKNKDIVKIKLFRLHEKLKDPKEFVISNTNKVLWNLYRLYRVRNIIVHRGNVELLGLPIEVLVNDLELYYTNLLDFITNKLSSNDRFSNIEELFISVDNTYYSFINKDGVSKIIETKNIKKDIINLPLYF